MCKRLFTVTVTETCNKIIISSINVYSSCGHAYVLQVQANWVILHKYFYQKQTSQHFQHNHNGSRLFRLQHFVEYQPPLIQHKITTCNSDAIQYFTSENHSFVELYLHTLNNQRNALHARFQQTTFFCRNTLTDRQTFANFQPNNKQLNI